MEKKYDRKKTEELQQENDEDDANPTGE